MNVGGDFIDNCFLLTVQYSSRIGLTTGPR
jgi:hypothetical protein